MGVESEGNARLFSDIHTHVQISRECWNDQNLLCPIFADCLAWKAPTTLQISWAGVLFKRDGGDCSENADRHGSADEQSAGSSASDADTHNQKRSIACDAKRHCRI
jgi:hypothetical protein